MKSIRRIAGILTLLTLLIATQAMAEKFVVGYQPYDTISYQAIINAELGLWKKYVPKGTEIEFQGALQGTVVANNMLADKAHVGYMSVMPATILCSKPEQAEIKMVATAGMSEGTRCSLVLVRKDAPQFKSNEELAQWLNGKVIAAPKGSASDQYLMKFFEKYNVKPAEYLNQSIEVIGTNFRIGKLDAASLWEPTLSRIAADVGEGNARIVADGRACDNPDLGMVVMRKDFIEKYPEVAKGYLRAELEAQRYLIDPANWQNVVEMVSKARHRHPQKRSLVFDLRPGAGQTRRTQCASGSPSTSTRRRERTSPRSHPSCSKTSGSRTFPSPIPWTTVLPVRCSRKPAIRR